MLGFGIFGRIKRSTFVRTPKDPCSTGKLGCGPHRRWHRHAAPTPACWRAGLFSDYFSGIPTIRALGVQNYKILTVRISYLPHNGESEILSQKATRAPAALRSRGGGGSWTTNFGKKKLRGFGPSAASKAWTTQSCFRFRV